MRALRRPGSSAKALVENSLTLMKLIKINLAFVVAASTGIMTTLGLWANDPEGKAADRQHDAQTGAELSAQAAWLTIQKSVKDMETAVTSKNESGQTERANTEFRKCSLHQRSDATSVDETTASGSGRAWETLQADGNTKRLNASLEGSRWCQSHASDR